MTVKALNAGKCSALLVALLVAATCTGRQYYCQFGVHSSVDHNKVTLRTLHAYDYLSLLEPAALLLYALLLLGCY